MPKVFCNGSEKKQVPVVSAGHAIYPVDSWRTRRVTGTHGELYFSELELPGISMQLYQFMVRQELNLEVMEDYRGPLLYVGLFDPMEVTFDGAESTWVQEGRVALRYSPNPSFRTTLVRGEYTLFYIRLTPERVAMLTISFYKLASFYAKVLEVVPALMVQQIDGREWDTVCALREILECPYSDGLAALYLRALTDVFILSAAALLAPGFPRLYQVPYSLLKAYKAAVLIQENIEKPHSIQVLASKVKTNDFDLKRNFKKLYGTTILDYLVRLRMQKAIELLIATDLPERVIARQVGYRYSSAFIRAFRSKIGIAPSALRKNKHSRMGNKK